MTLDELRRWAARAPPGTLIPADSLAAMLAGVEDGDDRLADLTVEEASEKLKKAPSTVRAWLIAGELRGYKIHGREWRVSPAAIREFFENQKNGIGRHAVRSRGRQADLGEWKQHVKM